MSGCADVCLSGDYDNAPEFCANTTTRARKPHQCCECREPIAVGESHESVRGKWDGVFQTFRTCAACVDIRNAFCCNGWAFEMLWGSMRDEMFPLWHKRGAWDCLAKLTTPEAVELCNARFREWLTDNEYDEPITGAPE